MTIKKINVGKGKYETKNTVKVKKPFKTLSMFKNKEELIVKADYLISKKFEVVINEKLLKLQYR